MFEEVLGLFFLGIATFLSPCSIALMSVYLTYAVGVSKNIRKGFIIGISFCIAMCLVFFFLGYAVVSLIPLYMVNYRLFLGIAGLLLIFFGVNNLGLFKRVNATSTVSKSFTERVNALKLTTLMQFSKYNYAIGSFLFGIVISLAMGPCSLSLVFSAIMLTIFSAPTPFHGGLLLFAFGLGHALPVIFLSALLVTVRETISKKIALTGEWLTRIFGLAFVIIGAIMIMNALGIF